MFTKEARPALRRLVAVLGTIIMVALLGACARGPGGSEPVPLLNWADVIEDSNLSHSVYAIGFLLPGLACFEADFCADVPEEMPAEAVPETVFMLVGTGFVAHYSNAIWTNAHVALAIHSLLPDSIGPEGTADAGDQPDPEDPPFLVAPVAVRAGTAIGDVHTHRLDVASLRVHPDYDAEADASPDLAVFLLDDASTFQDVPSFLPRSFASQLRVGQPVGALGFPGELSPPVETVPIATFKEGTISALRPYLPDEPEVTPENSRVVQFNLGQTGGTSGSPVFDHQGFIVAVNFAGIGAVVVDDQGFPTLIPIGHLDFGIRVDEVWTLIDVIEAEPDPPPAGSRIYPYPTYRAYPQNWNEQTQSAPMLQQ